MRYPSSILDEIKARLPTSTVVGRRVRLKKAGKEWKGLSPFTVEKTPSFTVNDQKQFYHCFSSGKHGDIFRFLMETEGVSFFEAVERLAQEVGVELPKNAPQDPEVEEKRKSLYDVMELAAQFFTAKLTEVSGSEVQRYLEQRELSSHAQERFRLGYAPSARYALRDFLAEKGFSSDMMIEAGMLISGNDIPVPFDRFRHRLMIPIQDARGRVIAFGGRTLSADTQPKYLNSPTTPLFNKGSQLYNYHNARKAAFENGSVIVVEGYMDVIALDQAGISHAVAPLGTAVTEDQIALLWRMVDEPILCFDGDKAGRAAAFRVLDLAIPTLVAGKSLRFVLLPDGQDPDDIVRSGGKPALEQLLKNARPLVDMLWSREREAGSIDTPERRAAMEKRLRESIATIKDETVRRNYRDEISMRLEATRPQHQSWQQNRSFHGGRQGKAYPLRSPQHPNAMSLSSGTNLMARVSEPPREAFLVAAFLSHPHLVSNFAEELAALELRAPSCRVLLMKVMEYAAFEENPNKTSLEEFMKRADLLGDVKRLKDKVRPGDRDFLDAECDPQRLIDTIRQALTLQLRVSALHRELQEAEYALAEDLTDYNFKRLQDVKKQLSSLEGIAAEITE